MTLTKDQIEQLLREIKPEDFVSAPAKVICAANAAPQLARQLLDTMEELEQVKAEGRVEFVTHQIGASAPGKAGS